LRATLGLLDSKAKFTALFCVNDQTAYGACLALFRKGLSVPGDVSLVGFDDLPSSAYRLPPLTSVRQSIGTLGEQSAQAILELVSGRRPRISPPPRRARGAGVNRTDRGHGAPRNQQTAYSMNNLNCLDALCARFPTAFVWGVASSAFQIEGAAAADGKGPSIWDEFCRRPGTIVDGSDGEIACDHYNRLEADLDLIAALGVRAYRFSISWPRIQPTGSGAINAGGLDFYNRLVDALLQRNIQPFATLYHWTCRPPYSMSTTGGRIGARPIASRSTPRSSRNVSATACARSRHTTSRG